MAWPRSATPFILVVAFAAVAPPTFAQRITGFTPGAGPPGTLVKIIGTDLDRVTDVLFHGVESPSFRFVSSVHLKAVVPEGTTTGPVAVIARDGTRRETRTDFVVVPAVGVQPELTLALPRPNPAPGALTLDFTLTARGPVRLVVYDLHARLVRTLANAELPAGLHARTWDGRDDLGHRVANGVYLVQLEAEGDRLVRRIAVLR